MKALAACLAGLVFGLGLIVAGMANPAKVLGFLDVAGAWDPSLAFVMGGAIALGVVAFPRISRRSQSVLNCPMRLPTAKVITPRLVGGSVLFGLGWGLAGICPGPGLVLLGAGLWQGGAFVAAMVLGMWLQGRFDRACHA